MSWVAKTARPAVGVCRTWNRGDVGAPAGKSFDVSVAYTEEADEGRETLKTESLAIGIDESLSVASIVAISTRLVAHTSELAGE
jgi:hypothetical protein